MAVWHHRGVLLTFTIQCAYLELKAKERHKGNDNSRRNARRLEAGLNERGNMPGNERECIHTGRRTRAACHKVGLSQGTMFTFYFISFI